MANILLIGLGGMGCSTVYRTKELFDERRGRSDEIACLNIDLDLVAFDSGITPFTDFGVSDAAKCVDQLWKERNSFRRWWPTVAREGAPYHHAGSIEKGVAAAQIRPNGRLAGIWNYDRLSNRITGFLRDQGALDKERASGKRGRYLIYVISSLGGGTGSGVLHDVVFALRENLQPEDTLFGILYDGSVVKTWAPDRTGIMSYAALIEVEHWLTRPRDYYEVPLRDSLEGHWRNLQQIRLDKLRYLDGAFLVQRVNESGGLMTGRRTGSVRDDYLELTAGWLYAMLVGDMLQKDPEAGKAGFVENVAPTLRSASMRYASTGDTGERAHLYGSIGVSLVSVPVKKIGEYLASSHIVEQFDSWQSTEAAIDPPVHFLSRNKLDESNDSQLTRRIQNLEGYTGIVQDLANARRQLEAADSYATLRKRSGSLQLDQGEHRWLPMLDAYEKTAENVLLSVILRDAVKALDEEVAKALAGGRRGEHPDEDDESRASSRPSHPTRLRQWLSGLAGALGRTIDKLQDDGGGPRGRDTSAIKRAFTTMRDAGKMARLMKWKTMRADLVASLNALSGLTRQRERHILERFYVAFKSEVERRDAVLAELEAAIADFAESKRTTRDSFRHRDYLLDESRLSQNEHPLELEVGTASAYVEDQKKQLMEVLARHDVVANLGRGKRDKESGTFWAGLATHYEDACHRLLESAGGDSRFDSLEVREAALNDIQNLIEQPVGVAVHDLLSNRFSVEEALGSLIKKFSQEARDYKGRRKQDHEVRRRFELHFGTDGARNLLRDNENAHKKAWEEEALTRLVWRVTTFSDPFWQLDPTDRDLAKGSIAQGLENRHMYVFAPQPKLRATLAEGLVPLLEGRIKKDHVLPFDDPHTLAVVQFDMGYPVFAIRGLAEDRLGYMEHIDNWRKKTVTQPYHVDRRFYDRWVDDLSRRTAATRATTEISHLLYLLGLGTGVLQLVRGKGRSRFVVAGKTFEQSLPKAIKKLEESPGDLEDLAKTMYRELAADIMAAKLGKKGAEERIWKVFLKGLEIHAGIEPPKTPTNRDNHDLWQTIASEGDIDIASDGVWQVKGDLVPRSPQDFGVLGDRLEGRLKDE